MPKREIAVIVYEGVQALDVAGPLDVFTAANRFLSEDEHYECLLIARDTSPVRTSNGTRISADYSYAQAERAFHTVLVAGGPELPNMPDDEAMSDWLRTWGTQATRYGSICTGAFALGRAGLIDGRTVTTHWGECATLASNFPDARVEHNRIYTRDGSLVTSAGVAAGIDLSLALVAEDHGAAVSLACAKGLVVVAQRQGGQSQFSPLLLPTSEAATPLTRVQAYVMEHLREAFPVERLADVAGVSPRSLARLFVAELQMTPHEFVEGVRIDRARNLLEATDKVLKEVAFDCGFASADHMRNAFQRRLGVTPLQYRSQFKMR